MEGPTNQAVARAAPTGGYAKFIAALNRVIDPIAKYGGYIGSVALAFMMFLTVFDVLGRGFGSWAWVHDHLGVGPIQGSMELTELALGVLVTFALGYCALRKGHIRVDLIMQYTSRKQNLVFDLFTYAISCLFYIGIAWQAVNNGIAIHENQLETASLAIPVYPFAFILVIGASIMALVLLRDFLATIEEVRK